MNAGLYDSTQAQKATSGNVQAALTAQGLAVCAFSAPCTVRTDGRYYCVVDMTTAYALTQPSLIANNNTGISIALSGRSKLCGIQTSQASLLAPMSLSDSGVAIWFGVN